MPLHGDKAPWNGPDITLPPEAGVPTMLTPEECRLLYWLGHDWALAAGAAVDLGCFAGGSTARIAAGVAAAGHPAEVHAFDHFTAGEQPKRNVLYKQGIPRFEGDDILPIAEAALAPFAPRVHLHQGDLTEGSWRGGPIGLLFIDAAKSPQSTDRIAAKFFPHLIAGQSILVQQDYQHWRQPWIPAQMELLAGQFELLGWTEANTVFYRCLEVPSRRDLGRASVSRLHDGALSALLRMAMTRFRTWPQRAALARALMGLEDNPGVRTPSAFDRTRFTPERVASHARR